VRYVFRGGVAKMNIALRIIPHRDFDNGEGERNTGRNRPDS